MVFYGLKRSDIFIEEVFKLLLSERGIDISRGVNLCHCPHRTHLQLALNNNASIMLVPIPEKLHPNSTISERYKVSDLVERCYLLLKS